MNSFIWCIGWLLEHVGYLVIFVGALLFFLKTTTAGDTYHVQKLADKQSNKYLPK